MTILDDLYRVWSEHHVNSVVDLFHDEFTYTDKCLDTVFDNRDDLGQFLTGTFVSMPDLRFDVVSSFQTPDGRFAGEAQMKGTFKEDLGPLKATGEQFVVNLAVVGELCDGKIYRFADYWNFTEFVGG
jgi:steroid delta-isomerase-like uncharacterized protein